MKWIKILFYNLAATAVLFFLIDFTYTTFVRGPHPFTELLRMHDAFFYTFKKQQKIGKTCTDKNGFKAHCNDRNRSSLSFDVVFIGDSFTEGTKLFHEETFVGMYEHAHPLLKVANLGVSSYSPTRYLQKISYYLDKGMETKHVVVFIDMRDIYDELDIHRYELLIKQDFLFFIYKYFHFSSKIIKWSMRELFYSQPPAPSRWPYDLNMKGFEPLGVSGAIERSLSQMDKLWELLNQHGAKLSVGVYPYLEHLRDDNKENIQVAIWREFCEKRCFAFINAFPAFLRLKQELGNKEKYLDEYTVDNRWHFNKNGNRVLFELIDKELKID